MCARSGNYTHRVHLVPIRGHADGSDDVGVSLKTLSGARFWVGEAEKRQREPKASTRAFVRQMRSRSTEAVAHNVGDFRYGATERTLRIGRRS